MNGVAGLGVVCSRVGLVLCSRGGEAIDVVLHLNVVGVIVVIARRVFLRAVLGGVSA